jgi:phosphoenolpyruvate synthase/pyruvate phosphate dikinase
MQVRFMLTTEVGDALLHGKINRKELERRTEFCVYYVEKGVERVVTGMEAEQLAKHVKPKIVGEVQEFKGQTGCVGKARGIVKIIIRPADMAKMNDGDILVSIATDPDIIPAMKKAAAFITEQGGVTSHAAIVAREMKKPCIIGTKIATKVLKDGDLVEVDATAGIVRIIKTKN